MSHVTPCFNIILLLCDDLWLKILYTIFCVFIFAHALFSEGSYTVRESAFTTAMSFAISSCVKYIVHPLVGQVGLCLTGTLFSDLEKKCA